MVGSIIGAVFIVPLTIPGYMLGSWRWLRRIRSYWEVAFVLAVFLFAWYGVLKVLGGSQALVPPAILAMVGGYVAGRLSYERRRRSN